MAASMKAVVKHSTLVRSFLRRGFFKNSLAVHVSPRLSPNESAATPSTLVLKEDGVEGAPFLLREVFNGLIQSQKWPVGFGPFGRSLCGIRTTRFGMGRMETPFSLWVFSFLACLWIGRWMVLRTRIRPR